jgi:hypothetical protein
LHPVKLGRRTLFRYSDLVAFVEFRHEQIVTAPRSGAKCP